VNLAALEAEILKDLNAAPAILAKVKDVITKVKGSPIEAFVERIFPGITTVEDEALTAIDFLSGLDAQVIAWLSVLFPKPAA